MGIRPRDDLPPGWVRDGDWVVPWWHSREGIIVKWVIFLVIFLLIMGYILGGYWHAKRGCERASSRWRTTDAWSVDGRINLHTRRLPHGQHGTPVYDPNRPPMYPGQPAGPPEGGSKVDPSQWRTEPTRRAPESNPAPDYAPPAGPPPANTR
ncbi:hypothetical protein ACCO45_007025 [Purpureocillium lilacinum]|uniref:Uncharacterized protein n=1 Tax=Purpureocillium lilacinum TaxID=33203 RepID=A0ACC4DS74_PURLI